MSDLSSCYKEWRFKALTNVWTGDAEGNSSRLIPTGILGSIRWWFEVLVRGLGGKACDPTDENTRCPDNERNPSDPQHRCVVCELFGCTGWARKFRLMILDNQGNFIQKQIEKGDEFILRFIPLRPIQREEWCLLDLTLRLIADYGAIGGRTVFKPSDERGRQDVLHHRDFGLIEYINGPADLECVRDLDRLKSYVSGQRWRSNFDDEGFSWASLESFWFVKGRYLARQNTDKSTFNRVLGRKESKQEAQQLQRDDKVSRWLAGSKQESKKVFSFRAKGGLTFGFVKPNLFGFDQIKQLLLQAWPDFEPDKEFKRGEDILQELIKRGNIR